MPKWLALPDESQRNRFLGALGRSRFAASFTYAHINRVLLLRR